MATLLGPLGQGEIHQSGPRKSAVLGELVEPAPVRCGTLQHADRTPPLLSLA